MLLLASPNVTAQWIAFLLHIWEVVDSNLSPEFIITDIFVVFLSPSRKMLG
jgi:hypothetical protein